MAQYLNERTCYNMSYDNVPTEPCTQTIRLNNGQIVAPEDEYYFNNYVDYSSVTPVPHMNLQIPLAAYSPNGSGSNDPVASDIRSSLHGNCVVPSVGYSGNVIGYTNSDYCFDHELRHNDLRHSSVPSLDNYVSPLSPSTVTSTTSPSTPSGLPVIGSYLDYSVNYGDLVSPSDLGTNCQTKQLEIDYGYVANSYRDANVTSTASPGSSNITLTTTSTDAGVSSAVNDNSVSNEANFKLEPAIELASLGNNTISKKQFCKKVPKTRKRSTSSLTNASPFTPSHRKSHSSSPSAPPGPIPATTPTVVRRDEQGIEWIAFEYSKERVKSTYTIRCDIETVILDKLPAEFKKENCIYPRATVPASEYTGNRQKYETECNCIGWCLAHLNPVLRVQRGLIQRAVDSWRNTNADPSFRSRRVRRMFKKQAQLERRLSHDVNSTSTNIMTASGTVTTAPTSNITITTTSTVNSNCSSTASAAATHTNTNAGVVNSSTTSNTFSEGSMPLFNDPFSGNPIMNIISLSPTSISTPRSIQNRSSSHSDGLGAQVNNKNLAKNEV